MDADFIRMRERIAAGHFSINGTDLAPVECTVRLGRDQVDYIADMTVQAIMRSGGAPP